MKLNELIRRLKKLNYKVGNIDCVSPLGDNFTPLEFYEMEDPEKPIAKPKRLVFGPIGTKALIANRSKQSQIERDIQEAQLDE
jgi:hypothetical protein